MTDLNAVVAVVAESFRRYAEPVYQDLCRSQTEARAEVILQEAFLRLFDALESGQSIEHPDQWVNAEVKRILKTAAADAKQAEPI